MRKQRIVAKVDASAQLLYMLYGCYGGLAFTA